MKTAIATHTPTPWSTHRVGNAQNWWVIKDATSTPIAQLNDYEKAEERAAYIVRAVNVYEKDQETIRDLVKAVKAQMQMRDMKRPTKLEEHLSWTQNDDLANKWALEAIAKSEVL